LKSRLKLVALNLVDAALLNAAFLSALALRFDGSIPARYVAAYAGAAPAVTFWILFLLNAAGINRSLWRYAGVPTLLRIVQTLTLGFGALYLANALFEPNLLPKSVVILSWILSTGLILASRTAWKVRRLRQRRHRGGGETRILIAGAGDVGARVADELLHGVRYSGTPVGFVDDDARKFGRHVEGLEVLGSTFDLPRLIKEHGIHQVIIAAPSAPARLVGQIVAFCQEAGVACKTMPGMADFIHGQAALGQVRDVEIEDLLGRESVVIDNEGIEIRVQGRAVLVTGAGGSIGSELCRQIARFHPKQLVAVDHCENRLTFLGLDLAEHFPELSLLLVVADVRDESGMEELMRTHGPDLVFHAAAHKHVNFLERSPREAVLNNILGTRNVARACAAVGVETFVFISTDKAVNPSSVMGATKRAGEILLQAMARDTKTTFVAVRFGNVLGSDGSVLPIFRRQLKRGGPLTVTHPDARRYFMTIPEASQLVIQAALLGDNGEVFVLDMGEPVRIASVAEQLIRLSGLRPGIDVEIQYIGLRPGEKMEEELLTESDRAKVTRHSKIFRWDLDPVEPRWVEESVDALIRLAQHAPPAEIRLSLGRLVPEYQVLAVAPLPLAAEVGAAQLSIIQAVTESPPSLIGTRPGRGRLSRASDLGPQRMIDIVVSSALLVGLAPVAGLGFALYRIAGSGRVRFVRETRIGRNRRVNDRRAAASGSPIDRRGNDRRKRPLPGPPFLTYRIEMDSPERNQFQRSLAGGLARYRLDRVLLLWNVARGQMSLIGPSARLLDESSFTQDWPSTWAYSRRPGLIWVGRTDAKILGANPIMTEPGAADPNEGSRGEIGTLLRSVPRLLRGRDTATVQTVAVEEPEPHEDSDDRRPVER